MIRIAGFLLWASVFHAASAGAADPMAAFPPAGPGVARFVINLPKLQDEQAAKVELQVGKTEKLDPNNRYFFGGTLKAETIAGWGYTRYVLDRLGPLAGTLMAVDPSVPKVDRFVTLGGEPRLVRYNSRLPIVVYVPEGVEVRYRLWRAQPEFKPAAAG